MASTDDPLELEHVIGWTGRYTGTLLTHPKEDSVFFAALGATVCIGNIYDPHKQRFLRGHDNTITALAVSSTGRLLASGQVRSTQVATGDACVMVWDQVKGTAVYTFFGMTEGIQHLAFSPDERFLAAAAADNTLSVWDMTTGEQVYAKRQGTGGGNPQGIHFIAWGPVTLAPTTKRAAYTLAFTVFERVHVASLEFDFRVMRYTATPLAAQLPATGFSRTYTSGVVDPSGRMLVAGTGAGELAVYAVQNAGNPTPIFKTALAAAGNGVHALCMCGKLVGGSKPALFLGGGDGVVRCFVGADFEWTCTAEARLPSRVVSIALSAAATWLLVGTSTGKMYRVAWSVGGGVGGGGGGGRPGGASAVIDLSTGALAPPGQQRGSGGGGGGAPLTPYADLIGVSHSGPVTGVSFHPQCGEAVVSVGGDGTVRLWNLNDYSTTWSLYGGAGSPPPQCVWVASINGASSSSSSSSSPLGLPAEVYAGYADGTLRAYGVRGGGEESGSGAGGRSPSELWRANAHRGGVVCMSGNRAVVVTGGGDNRVNVWSRSNHDLLLSFNDHSRPIVHVAVDPRHPEVVYSSSSDNTLATYNLRAERRTKSHALPPADSRACTITALAQLTHPSSEFELLAGTSDGRIYVFDPDVQGVHAGAVDVLALLAGASGSGGSGGGGGGKGALPKAKPGQHRPEFKITAMAVSPSSRYLALATACGRVCVLGITALLSPASAGAAGRGGGGGGSAASAAAAIPHRGPINAGTFTDLSGTVRPSLVSQAALMTLLSTFYGRAHYADVKWAPDERQLVAVCLDSTIQVFNFYG